MSAIDELIVDLLKESGGDPPEMPDFNNQVLAAKRDLYEIRLTSQNWMDVATKAEKKLDEYEKARGMAFAMNDDLAKINAQLRRRLENGCVFNDSMAPDTMCMIMQERDEMREALEDARKVIGESDMELQAAQFRTAHALLRSWLSAHPETKEEK
jgi:hypothetical protein